MSELKPEHQLMLEGYRDITLSRHSSRAVRLHINRRDRASNLLDPSLQTCPK